MRFNADNKSEHFFSITSSITLDIVINISTQRDVTSWEKSSVSNYFLLQGVSVSAVTAAILLYWVAVGTNIEFPYSSHLPTITDNCTFPANTTVAPIPQDK